MRSETLCDLLEALAEAWVIDIDGIYDPNRPDDRLLLGIKSSTTEFELGVVCARMLDAKHGKALRGDLRITIPIDYLWHREMGLGLDRVQEAVQVVSARFRQLGSARLECERRPGPGTGEHSLPRKTTLS
jgi:hypothetical protein